MNIHFLNRRPGWVVVLALALAAIALPAMGLRAQSALEDQARRAAEQSRRLASQEAQRARAAEESSRHEHEHHEQEIHEQEIHEHESREHERHEHADVDIVVDRDVKRRNPLTAITAFGDRFSDTEEDVVIQRKAEPKVDRRVVTRRAVEIRRKDADGNESVIRLDGDELPDNLHVHKDFEAIRLASQYAKAKGSEKEEIRQQLVRLTEQAFDERVEQREKEIQQMRSELDEVADRLRQRRAMRKQIIDRRIADLLDSPDPMKWNMEPLPGRASPRIDVPQGVDLFIHRGEASDLPMEHRIERREFIHPSPEGFLNRFRRRETDDRRGRDEARGRARNAEDRAASGEDGDRDNEDARENDEF